MPEASSPERLGWSFVFAAVTLAWLVPNHYPPWTSFYNEAAMIAALVAMMVLVFAFAQPAKVPWAAWFVVAVALVPWLQYALGVLYYSGDAFVSSGYVVCLALAIFVGHASVHAHRMRLALLLCFAALTASSISAFLAVSQTLQLASWGIWAELATPDSRAGGNLAQPNNFATLLGLGAAGAMYLYERNRLARLPAVGLVALLVLAGALTQSRVSLALGLMFMIAIWLLRARGVRTRTPMAAAAAFTALHWALMLTAPWILITIFGEAPANLASRGIDTPRYQIWRMLLDAVRLVPWQGYGWLQVGAAELAVADRYPPVRELWLQGHNLVVELIVWCGWALGLFVSAALLLWYASRVRRIHTLEAAVGVLVISIIGLHSLFELPHHYAYFLIPAGAWAGIVEREQGAAASGRSLWLTAPALAAFAIFGAIAVEYPAVEDDFRLVRFESARLGTLRASQPAPDAPLLSSLTSFLRVARTEPRPGMSDDQLRSILESTKRYPYAASLARYAAALALNGRPEEARQTFVKIRYLYGDNMYVRLKDDLHEKVAAGQSGLAQLDALLPPVQSILP